MRNNHGHHPQRGQGNRGRQGPMRGRQGRQQQYGQQSQLHQPQQQYGRQERYENPESRYRQQAQSSGWRSQSGGGWDDDELREYGQEFQGERASERDRWDRWNDDLTFAEQQYGEGRDRFGDQGARSYYGGAGAGGGRGSGAGHFGFTGEGEVGEQGMTAEPSGWGREGGYGGQSYGSQSYGGMGFRGERSPSRTGMQRQPQRYAPGPKGYKRSDERIKEDVSDRISQLHDVDASDVELEVKNGEVTLTGSVPTRDMKWQLEALTDSIAGVTDVSNQLRIKREGSMSSSEKPTSTSTGRK